MPTPTPTSSAIWMPKPLTTFQWQISGDSIDYNIDAQAYDVDAFDASKDTIDILHKKGKKVICYVNVGSYEDWRSDKNSFPASILGKDYSGWPGEKWLDTRKLNLLGPIMKKRFDMAKQKGCDSIEPDNMDNHEANSGFAITYQDQLKYNIWIANEVHSRGMSVGLKNNSGQLKDLLSYYDWALTESCYDQGWCDDMLPFTKSNKAVFQVEYTENGTTLNQFCPQAKKNQFTGILKHRILDAWVQVCK